MNIRIIFAKLEYFSLAMALKVFLIRLEVGVEF